MSVHFSPAPRRLQICTVRAPFYRDFRIDHYYHSYVQRCSVSRSDPAIMKREVRLSDRFDRTNYRCVTRVCRLEGLWPPGTCVQRCHRKRISAEQWGRGMQEIQVWMSLSGVLIRTAVALSCFPCLNTSKVALHIRQTPPTNQWKSKTRQDKDFCIPTDIWKVWECLHSTPEPKPAELHRYALVKKKQKKQTNRNTI